MFTSTFIFSSGGFIIGGEFAGVFFFFSICFAEMTFLYFSYS